MNNPLKNFAVFIFIGGILAVASAAQPIATGYAGTKAPAANAVPVSELDSGGCVGRNLDICLAYLAQAMIIRSDSVLNDVEVQRQRNT